MVQGTILHELIDKNPFFPMNAPPQQPNQIGMLKLCKLQFTVEIKYRCMLIKSFDGNHKSVGQLTLQWLLREFK